MTRPTVLVTGGAGYIGSHAVLALLEAGWPVVVIDNLVTGFRWALPDDVPFVEGDIADDLLVEETLVEHRVGAIMHFAGSIVVPESIENPLKYYRNNTAASRALIDAAVCQGVKHVIFSSTAATYGIPDQNPVREDTPQRPINPYGRSKLMTEQMLADVAAAHPMNYGVLRYFNVSGADPEGRVGQSMAGATHLMKVALETALGRRDKVQVFGDDFDTPDGTGVRDYIHVSDLVAAHVLTLEALIAEPERNLILNCGYGHGYSVLEVLDAVERIAGTRIARDIIPRRAGDAASVISANAAIKSALGWQPRYDDLDTIVRHALRWEQILAEKRLNDR